jgi:oligoendopeptidase F
VIEPTEEEAAPTEKPKRTVRKKAAEKAAKTNSDKDEAMTHISSKLAEKLAKNGRKYEQILGRDSNGRFVRRTPKSE